MKLIDAVRSIQTKPYIAVVLATNKDIQEITTHILRTCSVSEYCVRSVYNSILDAHIALVCLKDGGVDLIELVAWYTAGRFEYLVEGFETSKSIYLQSVAFLMEYGMKITCIIIY